MTERLGFASVSGEEDAVAAGEGLAVTRRGSLVSLEVFAATTAIATLAAWD